jgi:release factor glutamine methyltransferase
MVYPPSEDSYLLEAEVKKYLSNIKDKSEFKVLDMGSGSGIQAKACIASGIKRKNIIAADIDRETIEELKKQKIPARKSNLFSNINKEKKFNLIIFNTPYLPEDKYDKKADTTGGKKGNEVTIKFLRKAKNYLVKEGVILLLFSSLSKPEQILAYAKKRNYKSEKLAEKNVGMMESLWVYKFY